MLLILLIELQLLLHEYEEQLSNLDKFSINF
jgi:hypothetical protein